MFYWKAVKACTNYRSTIFRHVFLKIWSFAIELSKRRVDRLQKYSFLDIGYSTGDNNENMSFSFRLNALVHIRIIVAIFVVYHLNACLYCFETNRETRSTHRILHGARLQYKPCNIQYRLRSIKCAYFTGQIHHERSAHVYVCNSPKPITVDLYTHLCVVVVR